MEYKKQTTSEFLTEIQNKYGCMDSYMDGRIVGHILGEIIDQQIVAKERQEEMKDNFEKFLEIKEVLDKQIQDIIEINEKYEYDQEEQE